jgi:hypothetical protein
VTQGAQYNGPLHDAPGDIANFYIHDVDDVSGFSDAGIFSYRYNLSNHTVVHHNPHPWDPSGNGAVLSGLVGGLWRRTTMELNESPGGGPVGIWTYDAGGVLIRNCSSHDNLSKNNDGGGYDFDGSTTNSLITGCVSYNNYGHEACSYTYGVMNNGGHTQNNTVRDSTSVGDGYGKKFASVGVFPFQVPISEFHVANVTVDVTNPTDCTTWGQTYASHNGVWMEPGDASRSIFLNADVRDSSITCNGKTVVLNLACDSTKSPECVQS